MAKNIAIEEIIVKGVDCIDVSLSAGETGNGYFIKYKRILLNQSKIVRHEAPSIGLIVPKVEIPELVVALSREGYGWNAVYMFTDPDIGRSTIYESHYDLGYDTPLPQHYKKAKGVYDNLLKLLKSGDFKLHLLPNKDIGIEELVTK